MVVGFSPGDIRNGPPEAPPDIVADVKSWPITELIALLALLWAVASSILAWRLQDRVGEKTERRHRARDVEAALATALVVGHASDPLLEDGGFRLPDPVAMEARAETAIRGIVGVAISHPDDNLRTQANELIQALHALRYELELMSEDELRLGERTKAMALNVEQRLRGIGRLVEKMATTLRMADAA